jgi:hypothetical protein
MDYIELQQKELLFQIKYECDLHVQSGFNYLGLLLMEMLILGFKLMKLMSSAII